jgi:large subunit ribosomal protein L29
MSKEQVSFSSTTDSDLASETVRMEAEYNQMKFDHSVRGMANPLEIRELRREIARAKTEQRARVIAAFTPAEIALRSKIRARRARR